MGASLLSIDGWYPTLRGGPSPRAALNLEDDRSASELEALWPTLGPGERVVLRVPPSARARGRLSTLEALLEPSDQGESFVEFGGGGDVVALLPTARGASFRSSLDLLPSDLPGGRALSAFLRLASPFSLAQRFGRPEVVVWTRLGHALPDRDLPALPVDGDLAVRVHVRDRARPVEVRALDRRGAPRAWLKVGVSPVSDDAVRRESEAIRSVSPDLGERCSDLVAHGVRDGHAWLAIEHVAGLGAHRTLTRAHADLLLDLAGAGSEPRQLRECGSFTDGWRHLASLWRELDEAWHDDHSRLARAIERAAGDEPVPTTRAHGRFAPEALGGDGGALRAVDWQDFEPEAPALHDLFHFLCSTPDHPAAEPGEAAWAALGGLLDGEPGRVVRGCAAAPDQLPVLLGLSLLLDSTTAELRGRQRLEGVAPSDALRAARHELVRRCTELLEGLRAAPWSPDVERQEAA